MIATFLTAMLVLITNASSVQIPISSIESIQYNSDGSSMLVNTQSGQQSYAVADIQQMTISDSANAIESISESDAKGAKKILQDGMIYVIKEGKLYNLKGEEMK